MKKKVITKVVHQKKKSTAHKMAQARESRPLVPNGQTIERTVEVFSPRRDSRMLDKNTKLKASSPGDRAVKRVEASSDSRIHATKLKSSAPGERAVTRANRLSSTGDEMILVHKSSSTGHQRATAADGWRISSREEKHVRKVSSSGADYQFSSSEQNTTSAVRKISVPDRKISFPDKRPTSPVRKISSSDHRPTSPAREPSSPGHRPISPDGRKISMPDRNPSYPDHELASQARRGTSPDYRAGARGLSPPPKKGAVQVKATRKKPPRALSPQAKRLIVIHDL